MYHGNAQIFADRDVEVVRTRLAGTVRAVLEAESRPRYLVTACRLGDRRGLYTRDVFNRTPFRLQARRAGLVFAGDPHVEMTPEGAFRCEGWEAFDPDFVIASNVMSLDGTRDANRGAFLSFVFGILRVGDMTTAELRQVARLVRTADVLTEEDPALLVESIRSTTRG